MSIASNHRLAVSLALTASIVGSFPTSPARADEPPPPTIAPPAPGASEEKIEKAEQVAKASEVTPIVPSPHDATKPAFQLYAELDLPVLGIGLVFAGARLIRTQRAFCSPQCDPNDLNSIDRLTAGYWNPGWSTASDVALVGTIVGSAGLLLADEGALGALNDSVVIAESALSSTAIATMLTLAAGRPRPFLFGTDAPLSARESGDAALSFLSSHVAVTSATVASTFMALRRLHPDSSAPYVFLAAGTAVSAFVGTARVMAGKHFITDAVGGYIVGTSVGVLVPALHNSPVKVVPVVSETQRGVSLAGVF